MKKIKNTNEPYLRPNCEVIEIDIEQNILSASGTGKTEQLNDFNWEDW